jgi:hypothetical protein
MTEPALDKTASAASRSAAARLTLVGIVSFLLMAGVLAARPARAACVCRCVEGVMRSLCDNTIEIRPICPPTVCPITPPGIAPINPPQAPPLGTQQCVPRQVFNPQTGRYEWRTICY